MFTIGLEYRGGISSNNSRRFVYGNKIVPVTYLGKFSDVYETLDLNCNFIMTNRLTGYLDEFKIKRIYINDPKFNMSLSIEAESQSYKRYNGYAYEVYKVDNMCGYILKEINY